jgi:hypothetical protein
MVSIALRDASSAFSLLTYLGCVLAVDMCCRMVGQPLALDARLGNQEEGATVGDTLDASETDTEGFTVAEGAEHWQGRECLSVT